MKKILYITCVLFFVNNMFATGSKENTDQPVVIEMWYEAAQTEAGPPPADWIAYKIIRDKLNIDLRLTALPSAIDDQDVKIQAAGAGNALPDIFQVRRDPWKNLIKQGLIVPVDELYPLMPKRTERFYDADSKAYTTVNGKSYGLAVEMTVSKNEGVLIRKDWLDNLGLEIPVTIDDYLKVMKAFTVNDPDKNGKNNTYGFGAFIEINNYEEGLGRRFDPIFGAYGVAGTWSMSKENPGLNIRKPQYFEALSCVKKMIDESIIDPNWVSYKKDDFRAAWKQGRFGIMREQNGAYAAESNYAPFDKNFPDGEWMVIDPPKGPYGQSVGVYAKSYRVQAVSAKAAKAGKLPAIARLLEWMTTEEGYYLLGWGQENINFVFDKNGAPSVEGLADPSKAFTKPEMQPLTQLKALVFYRSPAELISRYPTYTTPTSGKTMSALDVLYNMQKRPWTSNIGADTMPAPTVDLKRFYEQGVLEFLTGKQELTKENWNAWLTEFDRLGGIQWEKDGIAYASESGLLTN